MPHQKKVKVWIEAPDQTKISLYEIPPTFLKKLLRLIEEYEYKPKDKPVTKITPKE